MTKDIKAKNDIKVEEENIMNDAKEVKETTVKNSRGNKGDENE